MKTTTSEEWAKKTLGIDFFDDIDPQRRVIYSNLALLDSINQLRLDAIKHGMTLAATIAVEHCLPGGYTDSPTDIAASQAGDRIGQEILTARDKLKEIPK